MMGIVSLSSMMIFGLEILQTADFFFMHGQNMHAGSQLAVGCIVFSLSLHL